MKINEIYTSIQGESTWAGLPCVFIRTSGCNLRCNYCDTTFAYNEGKEMSLPQILRKVESYGLPLVELTGGEPLLQPESPQLVRELCEKNYTVLVETSGSIDISSLDPRCIRIMDLKCPSSGEMESMHWDNIRHLRPRDEIKFVIGDERDFYWSLNVIRQHQLDQKCSILFACVFGTLSPKLLAEWMLQEKVNARLQLQLHKYIWDPKQRKV